MFIDFHCHLNHAANGEDNIPSDIIARALNADVDGMLTICCRIAEEMDELLAITRANHNVWCSVGTHPHDAGQTAEQAIDLHKLVFIAKSDPNIVGIGESGLDYFYNHSGKAEQQESFRKHIRACLETGLPLIIHARDADDDIIGILKEEGSGTHLKGVLHCFSSTPKLAEFGIDIGFYISFSGMITFKKMDWLRDIAKKIPLDKTLIETDAPFLAPAPYRGKTNEPAYIRHTAQTLADIHGMSLDQIATQTKNNFFRLFDRAVLV